MAMFQRLDQEEINTLSSMDAVNQDDLASLDTSEDMESYGVVEMMREDSGTASARNCIQPVAMTRRGRMAPFLLVGILAVVATISLAFWQEAASEEAPQPRLLQSEDLLSTIVEHSMRFHNEFAGQAISGASPTHQELLAEARKHVHETVHKVAGHSREAGRILQDLRLTKTQWSQSKQVLDALHDKRVLEMGQYVQKVVAESETPAEAMRRVATKEGELRQLREELLPAGVRGVAKTSEGQNHWGFSMQSGATISGPIGGWQGSMTIGGSKAVTRRLMDKAQLLYMIIASAVVVLFGIISTIMTAVLGPAAATIFFIITATLDAALCGTSLGLHHLPNFANIYTWVPCIVLTSFTGLETIWTFNKGGAPAGPVVAGPVPGPVTTTFPAP